jgi:hypothetical protein
MTGTCTSGEMLDGASHPLVNTPMSGQPSAGHSDRPHVRRRAKFMRFPGDTRNVGGGTSDARGLAFLAHVGDVDDLRGSGLDIVLGLHADVGEQPAQPAGEPPVRLAEDRHH